MRPSGAVQEGDDYMVWWAELDVGLFFSRVRETDASIRCLITPLQHSSHKRLMSPILANLFTLADRERIAKALTELVHGEAALAKGSQLLADWKDSVERAFSSVIDLHTTPEPLVNLATYEAPPDEGALVWPVLARNEVNVFLADQGSGKSYVGLFLAAAIAGGLFQLLPAPFRLMQQGPVVYFDAETNKATQRRRLERICAALELQELPPVHYRTIRPPLASHGALIRGYVAQVDALFAVFDSLTFLAGGDLNSTETAVPTMNVIGECGEFCTKLAIAHYSKAGRESNNLSVLGSGAFEFKARQIWIIRKTNEEDSDHIDQAWSHKKGSDERLHRGFGMRLHFNDANTRAEFSSLSASESAFVATHTGTTQERILAAVQSTEFWRASTTDIAKLANVSENTVRRVAPTMPELRLLEQGGQGRGKTALWEVTRNGLEARPSTNGHATENPHGKPPQNPHAGFPLTTPFRGGEPPTGGSSPAAERGDFAGGGSDLDLAF